MKIAAFAFAILAPALTSGVARAEQESIQAPSTSGEPAGTPISSAEAPERPSSIDSRLEALEKENKRLAEQMTELQEAQNQATNEPPSDIGKTKVFGFFDVSFGRSSFSKKDSVFRAKLPFSNTSSFSLTSLSVYLGNQITQKLKFLSELRFTYQPLGTETGVETYYVAPSGSTTNLGSKYTRTDTTVLDTNSGQSYRLGGVSMERVQVTYAASDYLAVTVGRFLTPCGIWNVDHGSPVILMTRAPIMQTQQIAPIQQLGVQISGRAYFASSLSLDYAATVSNGRGPMDTVLDLDDNKGLGLRWRLNYEVDDFSISLGQYGYTGEYTDISKAVYAGPGSADYRGVVSITNQYKEYVLTNDLLIKIFGLRLQSEAVIRRVKFNVPPKLDPTNFNGNPAIAGQYNASNYDSRAVYGLLAYELPQQWTTGKLRVTPFGYLERFDLNDTMLGGSQGTVYAGGINIKPYPSLVLKVEWDHVKFDDQTVIGADGSTAKGSFGDLDVFTAQLAVTF